MTRSTYHSRGSKTGRFADVADTKSRLDIKVVLERELLPDIPARVSGPRRHALSLAAVHVDRQPLLRVELQNAEVPSRVPRAVRRHRARPRALPPVLSLVQPRAPALRDRPHDPGRPPPRPMRRSCTTASLGAAPGRCSWAIGKRTGTGEQPDPYDPYVATKRRAIRGGGTIRAIPVQVSPSGRSRLSGRPSASRRSAPAGTRCSPPARVPRQPGAIDRDHPQSTSSAARTSQARPSGRLPVISPALSIASASGSN
jgi:hypothetical protein